MPLTITTFIICKTSNYARARYTLVNVTDTFNPVLVSNVKTIGSSSFISTLPQYPNLLAVADGNAGVTLVNITDIFKPTLVSNVPTGSNAFFISTFPHYPHLLAVVNSGYYYTITLVNITNISRPILINNMQVEQWVLSVTPLAQYPNLLAVASTQGITLVNITDTFNPIFVSEVQPPGVVELISTLPQYPNLLVVVTYCCICLVDITDIFNPVLASYVQTTGEALFVSTLSQYPNLLINTIQDGISIIEVNYAPALQITLKTITNLLQADDGIYSALAQYNNLLLTGQYNGIINIYSIISPDINIFYPILISDVQIKGLIHSIATNIQLPNLLAVSSDTSGVTLVDITDISHPVLVSNVTTKGNAAYISTITQYPNLLAVADDNAGVTLVNITDIFKPILVSNVLTKGDAIFISTLPQYPNLLAVADSNAGITLINITNTSNPVLVSNVQTYKAANFIATLPQYPNILVVASENGGVTLVNITNISNLTLVSNVQIFPNYISTLAQYPNLLIVANGYGVALIEITSISRPIFTSNIQMSYYVESVTALTQYPNLLVVLGLSGSISIVEPAPLLALWTEYLPQQKVGQNIVEALQVYKTNPCELLTPNSNTITIQQIDIDGSTRVDIPSWLFIEKAPLTLYGNPPKEATGQEFVLEISFNGTGVVTSNAGFYKPLFRFDVISSLNLNKTIASYTLLNKTSLNLPTLAIDSIAELVTLTIVLSMPITIEFILTDNFDPIRPTFDLDIGTFQAFGAVSSLNDMLQRLRYAPLQYFAANTTGATVSLDDAGLNYPITVGVDMSFFRKNYAPVCSNNVIDVPFEINSNLEYSIPPYSCTDVDDSINGLGLQYGASSLPANLIFIAGQFSGSILPPAYGPIFINVTATDGYATDILMFRFVRPQTPKAQTVLMREVNSYAIPGGAKQLMLSQSEKLVYVASSSGIVILNVTNPVSPISINTFQMYGVQSITAVPQYSNLFAIAAGNVILVNITNVFNPTSVSNVTTRGAANFVSALLQHSNLLAIADGNAGVTLVNITNIFNPTLVSSVTTRGVANFVSTLLQNPNLLVIADGNAGVTLVDITDVFNPTLVSNVPTRGVANFIFPLQQYSNLLAVADGNAGVTLVDITNSSNPTLVSNVQTNYLVQSIATLAQSSNLLVVSNANAGVILVDITNIYKPILASYAQTSGYAYFVSTFLQYPNLLISTTGAGISTIEVNYLPVLQITSQTITQVVRGYSDSITTFVQHPNLLAVTKGGVDTDFINITDIYNPIVISNISTKDHILSVAKLTQYPNLLVVANNNIGMTLVNLTNISSPILVNSTTTMGSAHFISTLPQYPNLLAIADGNAGITLVDITNIYHSVLVGSVTTKGSASFITPLAQYPNLLAVASGNGITLVNITNIYSPVLDIVSNIQTNYSVQSIITLAQYPNLLAIASGNAGMTLVNITDTSNPVLVSSLQTKDYANFISAANFISTLAEYPNLLVMANMNANIALVDITNIFRPVLISNVQTAGNVNSILPLVQHLNLLAVTSSGGISIIDFTSLLALWTEYLPQQKVGQNIAEVLQVYKINPCELLRVSNPNTVTIKQIDTDGVTRIDIPYWLFIERKTLTLNGIPPKEAAGQEFVLELNFNGTSIITGNADVYQPILRFEVVGSLNLNRTITTYTLLNKTSMDLPTIAIDSAAQLVTLTLTLPPATSIEFIVNDDFGPIKPTFDSNTGIFQAFGAVKSLNDMLQHLRYAPLQHLVNRGKIAAALQTEDITNVTVTLDDAGLNYLFTDNVNMSFFRKNYAPVCSKNVTNIGFETNFNLDYTIPLYSCTDADDSVDGLGLQYSISALPEGLTFVANQMRFSGSIQPPECGPVFINVSATDGYATDILMLRLVRTLNHPPIATQAIQKLVVTTETTTETVFSPSNYFTDPNGDKMSIIFLGTPHWLTVTPSNLTIGPTATNTTSFQLTSKPSPADTNSFSNYEGTMSVQATDPFNGTTTAVYPYTVQGNSVVKLLYTYGATVLSVLITVYGFYAYRVLLYNAFAWDRYRFKHTQFGKEVDAFNLFAVKDEGGSEFHQISHHPPDTKDPTKCHMQELAMITRWSDRMEKLSDKKENCYFKHKVFEFISDSTDLHNEIKNIEILFVHLLPEHTRLERIKATVLKKIPIIFNLSFGRLLAKFGIKMNPDHFAIFEPANFVGGFPSWLQYDQTTKIIRVIDITERHQIYFNEPIVVRFKDNIGKIMEEITFIVRDDSLFTKTFPNIEDTSDDHSPRPFSDLAHVSEKHSESTTALRPQGPEIDESHSTPLIMCSDTGLAEQLGTEAESHKESIEEIDQTLPTPHTTKKRAPAKKPDSALAHPRGKVSTIISDTRKPSIAGSSLPDEQEMEQIQRESSSASILGNPFSSISRISDHHIDSDAECIPSRAPLDPPLIKIASAHKKHTAASKVAPAPEGQEMQPVASSSAPVVADKEDLFSSIIRMEPTRSFHEVRCASFNSAFEDAPTGRPLVYRKYTPPVIASQITPSPKAQKTQQMQGKSASIPGSIPGLGTSLDKPNFGFWGRYYMEGVDVLLPIRLLNGAKVLPSIALNAEDSSFTCQIPEYKFTLVVPVLYSDFQNVHWVGFIIHGCVITYIDPENKHIPTNLKLAVYKALSHYQSSIIFQQKYVQEQSYADNCAVALIERLAEIISGNSIPESVASQFYSWIFERFLMESAGYVVRELNYNPMTSTPQIAENLKFIEILSNSAPVPITLARQSLVEYGSFAHKSPYFGEKMNNAIRKAVVNHLYQAELSEVNQVLERYHQLSGLRNQHPATWTKKYWDLAMKSTHPDKRGTASDFIAIKDLRDKNEALYTNAFHRLANYLQPKLRSTIFVLKAVDLGFDAARAYNQPTSVNIKAVVIDGLHMWSMYSGFSIFSVGASLVSAGYAYYEDGLLPALYSLSTSAAYMVLPSILLAGASPPLALVYTASMTLFTGYHVVMNAAEIYQHTYVPLITEKHELQQAVIEGVMSQETAPQTLAAQMVSIPPYNLCKAEADQEYYCVNESDKTVEISGDVLQIKETS